jgi:hypothetical protein
MARFAQRLASEQQMTSQSLVVASIVTSQYRASVALGTAWQDRSARKTYRMTHRIRFEPGQAL